MFEEALVNYYLEHIIKDLKRIKLVKGAKWSEIDWHSILSDDEGVEQKMEESGSWFFSKSTPQPDPKLKKKTPKFDIEVIYMAESSNLLVKVLKITKFKFLSAHADIKISLAHVFDDNLFLLFNNVIFQSSTKP